MRPNAAILASALTAASTAGAATPAADPHGPAAPACGPVAPAAPRTLRVTADGRVTVRPDVAIVHAGVRVTAKEAARASADANGRMKTLLAELARLGVAERDVQTSAFGLTPERPWVDGRQLPVQGYTASSSVTVKVRALDRLPELLGRLPAAGANEIDAITFGRDELGPVRDEALALAVAAARARALAVARAAGVTLCEVLAIQVEPAGGPAPLGANAMLRTAMAGGAPDAPVAPGELEVTAAVELLFAIQ